jgi:low affinity Fe/Cu permease
MTSGHYCDGCAQAYYKCVCNKQEEKIIPKKMNERIKELLLQATTLRGPFIGFKVDQEKFAQLIVKECADIAKRNIGEPDPYSENYDVQVAAERKAQEIYEEIMSDFGVNE